MDENGQKSDEQQLLGAPYSFKWNGRVIKLGPLEDGQIAECVALCKSAAIAEHDELMSLRYPGENLTPAQQAKREADEDRFELRMTTGFYQWGNKGCHAWRSTRTGSQAFVELLCRAAGNPLNEGEAVQLMMDGGSVFGRIIAAITWDAEFPNVQRPPELMTIPAGH